MTTLNNDRQLELELSGAQRSSRLLRRERRLARAAWWFSKMRAVVNSASGCTVTAARPEQTFLPGTYRQVRF